jgi:hypothetical protein
MQPGDEVRIDNEYVDRDGEIGEVLQVQNKQGYECCLVRFSDGVKRWYFVDDCNENGGNRC